jgi:hypothetical protein
MRLWRVGAGLLGLAASLCGCVEGPYGPEPVAFTAARVDPEDMADRMVVGSVLGAALGTGLGASFAINPAIGAVIGVESGAAIGAAVGAITAQPLPS